MYTYVYTLCKPLYAWATFICYSVETLSHADNETDSAFMHSPSMPDTIQNASQISLVILCFDMNKTLVLWNAGALAWNSRLYLLTQLTVLLKLLIKATAQLPYVLLFAWKWNLIHCAKAALDKFAHVCYLATGQSMNVRYHHSTPVWFFMRGQFAFYHNRENLCCHRTTQRFRIAAVFLSLAVWISRLSVMAWKHDFSMACIRHDLTMPRLANLVCDE